VAVLKIFDRYVIREMLLPFALGLLVLTFVLEIPNIQIIIQPIIAKGVEWPIVGRLVLLLLPSTLSLTIPMAVLLAILIAFGRLSGDREFVAMQACGVSVFRLLRPVGLVTMAALAATAYETIVALPDANQTFREIEFGIVASHVESNVKPRVFFQDFPNQVLYVRDLPQAGGLHDVFLADTSGGGLPTVYVAREARILVDRANRTVTLVLRDGTQHTSIASRPDDYDVTDFESLSLSLNPQAVFPPPPSKGPPEKTIAELRETIAKQEKSGTPAYLDRFMIQYKFSIPASCLVLALLGIGLGVSNRKDGKLASFALGFVVIFVYYVLLYMSRAAALGGKMNPDWAPWVPNIVLGCAGVALLFWRARSADQPIRIGVPAFWRSWTRPGETPASSDAAVAPTGRPRVVLVIRVPHLSVPTPKLLDLYISREYARVFFIGLLSLLGIFYIATFIDLADKLFRGQATTALLFRYFFYQTPQFVYYVIPMAALVATLVTIGAMTKSSELVVMRACGISLYRSAAPVLLFAAMASLALFGLEERVLADANRQADRLNSIIRGLPTQAFDALNRQWMVGTSDDIYHYDTFDPHVNRFSHFTVYQVDHRSWRLAAVTFFDTVALDVSERAGYVWRGTNGWTRTLTTIRKNNAMRTAVAYTPFAERELSLEPPSYFKTEVPDALMMTYRELAQYVMRLKSSGFNAVPQMVQLQQKIAFPFVAVIMTLLAVPFAVTTGRRGALYGVGIGIVLAITYRVALVVFGALGESGVMPPLLAAWAPNILFGAGASYMILTVRT